MGHQRNKHEGHEGYYWRVEWSGVLHRERSIEQRRYSFHDGYFLSGWLVKIPGRGRKQASTRGRSIPLSSIFIFGISFDGFLRLIFTQSWYSSLATTGSWFPSTGQDTLSAVIRLSLQLGHFPQSSERLYSIGYWTSFIG